MCVCIYIYISELFQVYVQCLLFVNLQQQPVDRRPNETGRVSTKTFSKETFPNGQHDVYDTAAYNGDTADAPDFIEPAYTRSKESNLSLVIVCLNQQGIICCVTLLDIVPRNIFVSLSQKTGRIVVCNVVDLELPIKMSGGD